MKPYSLEKALEEASEMKRIIEGGRTSNYSDAEAQAEEGELNNFWNRFDLRLRELDLSDPERNSSPKSKDVGDYYSEKRSDLTQQEYYEMVDKVAVELGINLDELYKLAAEIRKFKNIWAAGQDMPTEEQKVWSDAVYKLNHMIYPIYQKLLEMGYTKRDVIG